MKHLYAIFAALAFSIFAWAQYNAYSLFDAVAAQQGAERPGSGTRSIFHK
ncbi:MAG: hypothetical protein LBQ62_10350 [Candidatus Accumulibacter sp.]|nr:hypothetical protein [Accumulibacter sp.]